MAQAIYFVNGKIITENYEIRSFEVLHISVSEKENVQKHKNVIQHQ